MGKADLAIESDTSLTGWGASSQGSHAKGLWSAEEKNFHINCLELLVCSLSNSEILPKIPYQLARLLKMDNRTAVAYVNIMGGTVSTQVTLLGHGN